VNENEPAVLLSNGLPQPPIPHRLREMLKDYPEHLRRLQEELNYTFDGPRPARGTTNHIFEQVIWALEGCLEAFMRDADEELMAAQASGDMALIAHADEKFGLMVRCRSSSGGMKLFHMDDLTQYIESHREYLR
jgi:predicted metal-dependent hydrolase